MKAEHWIGMHYNNSEHFVSQKIPFSSKLRVNLCPENDATSYVIVIHHITA